jgi:acetyl esterase
MPLDPVAQQIAAALHSTFPAIDFGRSGTAHRDMLRAAAAEVIHDSTEPIGSVLDRDIPGSDGPVAIRVYRPVDVPSGEPLPIAVFTHGGGWVVCDLDSHDAMCRAITNAAGCTVVAVDYRLAPEHRFPAGVEDAYAALLWVAAHGREIGGDPSRLAVIGDSAGGNLAAVVAQMARDRGGPALQLQILIYPVTDFRFDTSSHLDPGDATVLQSDEVRYFWYEYLPDHDTGAEPYASPLRAPSLAGLPPALVITAEYDPLRDEGEAYAARLAADGVTTTATRYDGVMHSFVTFLDALPSARQAVAQIGAALQAAFASADGAGNGSASLETRAP